MNTMTSDFLVIGGGVIGVEFADIFAAFGVQVTIIEMLDRLIKRMKTLPGVWLDRADAQVLLIGASTTPAASVVVRTKGIMSSTLVKPMSSRTRFIASHSFARGPSPDPEPAAAEHVEPWPGGRANHYLFDLNRDLFIQSQLETRGKTAMFLEY